MVSLVRPGDVPAFCKEFLGRPDLIEKRQGRDNKWLSHEAQTIVATRRMVESLTRARKAGIPCSPVNGYFDVARNEHLRTNNYIRDIMHREWEDKQAQDALLDEGVPVFIKQSSFIYVKRRLWRKGNSLRIVGLNGHVLSATPANARQFKVNLPERG